MIPPESSAEPNAEPRLRFPKLLRLRSKAEFERVYARKCKASDGVLLMFSLPNDLPHPRIGLSVSRKVGNAVVRNRVKRLLREAFRLSQHELPTGLDLVVIPLGADRAELVAYRQSLLKLSRKLQRRWQETPPTAATEPAERAP
ncbi:MAG: ribonuclease P protein component [Planctomycetaceae bacterium]|nr:ribonuclease P protein component [Planctomycetaceae bacterium]